MSNEKQHPTQPTNDIWSRALPSHVISTVTFSIFLLTSILQAFMAYNRGLEGDNALIFYAWCSLGLAQISLIVFINVKAHQRKQNQPLTSATED